MRYIQNPYLNLALLFPFFLSACASQVNYIHQLPWPEVFSARDFCKEHIVREKRITMQEWPNEARGRNVSAYVVISYELDGTGKAKNPKVIESAPVGLFDKVTMSLLEQTDFKVDVKAQSCTWVATYGAVKRADK